MTIPNKTFSNIQLRRGAAAIWTANNPLLLSGEVGIETDTNKVKIGNGVDLWNALDYFVGGGSVSLTLDELSDVNTTGAADGDALVYDSGTSTWIPGESASSVFVSDTAPLTPSAGDLWFDSTNGNTYIYYVDTDSSQWVGFGGGSSGYILGTVYPWPTSTVPSWALELNGQAVSRTTYSGLFAILGTTYGVGDGSTTFNLPDYRGDTLVGHDTTQTEFDVVGETGGVKSVTLTEAQMPSHTHIQNSHTHGTLNGTGAFIRTGTSSQNNANWVGTGASFGYDTSTGSATATNQNTGGGQAHTNLQPYAVVKWIICAATSAGDFDTEVQTALVGRVGIAESEISGLETRESLARVIPSSVSVGSGSGSFSASTGLVTFTSATSVSLNGVFSAAYRNYVIVWNVTSASGGAGMMARFGVGLVDDSTNYFLSYAERTGSGAWSFSTSTITLRLGRMGSAGAGCTARIYTPFLSDRRSWAEGSAIDGEGYHGLGSGYHSTNKSHDRLTLFPEGAVNMTGTVQVFGVL